MQLAMLQQAVCSVECSTKCKTFRSKVAAAAVYEYFVEKKADSDKDEIIFNNIY